MKRHGSVLGILGAMIAATSCSGRYQVGIEPGSGGAAGQMNAAGTSSGGASTTGTTAGAGGSVGQGGAAGAGIIDAAAPSRCGFAPDGASSAGTIASAMVLSSRIRRLLDDSPDVPPGALPATPTPAWAADLATSILDEHIAAGTEARGLVRFLTAWLKLPVAEAGISAADTWSVKLLDPRASLETLLAGPTGEPHRMGILTDRQVLTLRPTITTRGVWMLENLFCLQVPPPPPNTPVPDPTPVPGLTRRQNLENVLSGTPQCNGCHVITDPPGDSLEHFDAMGNYRDIDNGAAVDSSGQITSPMLNFTGYDDLAPQLASSCQVALCFTKAVMSDAFGVSPSSASLPFTEEESNHVANAFADSNFTIRELVKAIVRSPSFLR
jgi:hypothetical protein